MAESKFDDWVTNNIEERDKEVVKEIQNTLVSWVKDYEIDKKTEKQNQPTEEELKQIEEFRKKGFI